MSATTHRPYSGSFLMPSFEHATVADAMHPGVLSCGPDASLTEVARMMATHHVHCVAVIGLTHEDRSESMVWGIVSDLDLIQAGVPTGAEQTAATLARQPFITVEPTMTLREARDLMIANNAPHVLVVDPRDQRPVGVLSTLDIAGVLAWGEG